MEDNKVREATGATRERWLTAPEKEYVENFIRMNAFTETTPEELAEFGGQSKVLPMKCVWSIKEGDLYKCRGVVCGNFADRLQRGGVHSAGRNSIGDAGSQICSNEWMGNVETGCEISIPQCTASRGALGGSASPTSMGPYGICQGK